MFVSGKHREANRKGYTDFEGEIDYVESPTVVVKEVSKEYKVRDSEEKRGRIPGLKKSVNVHALKNISFVTNAGESIGLIGRNGSGKSTLLRLIGGGEPTTSGSLLVKSQPTLLGVTPALQGYLTGAQNIYLGCLALGMDNEEARAAVPEIAEWADIGSAVDRPMNTYSSGMSARLSFAISTAIRPEILLVDEALSTGDAAFAQKARERMQNLLQGAGNLFLVSHAPSVVEENCRRAIWLHLGELIADGNADEVVKAYTEWTMLKGNGKAKAASDFLAELKKHYKAPLIELD